MTVLRFKRLHPHAIAPQYASVDAAGIDLAALENAALSPGEWVCVRTGLAFEIPSGFEGQIRPRSGLAARHGVTVLNSPGTIDADYRGEVLVPLINHGAETFILEHGDRIAQLIVSPVLKVAVEEAETLTQTCRGTGGFGSTGR